jgi:hypothetical protein
MAITRYLNEPRAIDFDLGNFFKIHNKTYADVEDIILNFKIDTSNDEDDAYLQKKQSENGVYLDQGNARVYMHLNTQLVGSKIVPSNGNDYDNLTVNTYILCGGVKFTGIDRLVEFQFLDDDKRQVKIINDTNRA